MSEIRASEAARDYRAMHRLLGTVRDEAVALHTYAMSRPASEEGAKLIGFLVNVRSVLDALALDALAGAEGQKIVRVGVTERGIVTERTRPVAERESGVEAVNDAADLLHLPPAA